MEKESIDSSTNTNEVNELRPEGDWDDVWGKEKQPKSLNKKGSLGFQFDRLMKEVLEKEGSFLEIGCAGGKFMVYFGSEFGYEVSGVDYSQQGCELARRNLELAGIKGAVVCSDLFKCDEFEKESFDVVFSGGFIEHFDDTEKVLGKHVEFLRPGGTLVIELPNMYGLHGWVFKLFNRSLFDAHKALSADDVAGVLTGLGLEVTEKRYVGPFIFECGLKPKFMAIVFGVFNKVVFWLARITHIFYESKKTSGYIVVVGRKKG